MNLLTIDFDWIMAPVINAYNDMVGSHEDDIIGLWQLIKRRMPGINFQPDWNLFAKIRSICEMYAGRLYKIQNHDQVVPFCEAGVEVLINLDHHHDYYGGDGLTFDCSNWVKRLEFRKQFKKYIWIPSPTSILELDKKPNFFTASSEPMDTLRKYTIDQVVLCQSPQWLSPECNELWEMFTSTLDFLDKE